MKIVSVFTALGICFGGFLPSGSLSAAEPLLLTGTAGGSHQCTSFSPDSKLLVTQTTGDNSLADLTVFDVQTRSSVQSLPLPGDGSRSFHCIATCFSADGKWMAAIGNGRSAELFLWSTTNWERTSLAPPDSTHGGFNALALSADGAKVAASRGDRDNQAVYLLDRSWKVLVQFPLPGSCRSLRFTDDDRSLVCALQRPTQKRKDINVLCVQTWSLAEPRKISERENIVQWDLPRLRLLAQDGAGVGVHQFILSPDAAAIATSAWRDISAFSLSSGKGGNLGQHELNTTALAISADKKVLASGGHWSGGIWLWDLASGRRQQKLMFTPQPPHSARYVDPTWERGTCRTIALSPDGQYAAATTFGGKDNSIFLWKIEP